MFKNGRQIITIQKFTEQFIVNTFNKNSKKKEKLHLILSVLFNVKIERKNETNSKQTQTTQNVEEKSSCIH